MHPTGFWILVPNCPRHPLPSFPAAPKGAETPHPFLCPQSQEVRQPYPQSSLGGVTLLAFLAWVYPLYRWWHSEGRMNHSVCQDHRAAQAPHEENQPHFPAPNPEDLTEAVQPTLAPAPTPAPEQAWQELLPVCPALEISLFSMNITPHNRGHPWSVMTGTRRWKKSCPITGL